MRSVPKRKSRRRSTPTTRAEGLGKGGPEELRNSKDSKESQEQSDAHLFADPYAVLAEIAANTGVDQNISPKGDGGAQSSARRPARPAANSYRDPFAPDFWTKQVDAPDETEANRQTAAAESAMTDILKQEDAARREPRGKRPRRSEAPNQQAEAAARVEVAPVESAKPATEAKDGKPIAELYREPSEPEVSDERPSRDAVEKAREIKQEIAKAMGTGDKLGNGLDVVATDKGVMISVTDDFDFGMFEIGSALPRRDLVLAMEKIGKVLSATEGNDHHQRPYRRPAIQERDLRQLAAFDGPRPLRLLHAGACRTR